MYLRRASTDLQTICSGGNNWECDDGGIKPSQEFLFFEYSNSAGCMPVGRLFDASSRYL